MVCVWHCTTIWLSLSLLPYIYRLRVSLAALLLPKMALQFLERAGMALIHGSSSALISNNHFSPFNLPTCMFNSRACVSWLFFFHFPSACKAHTWTDYGRRGQAPGEADVVWNHWQLHRVQCYTLYCLPSIIWIGSGTTLFKYCDAIWRHFNDVRSTISRRIHKSITSTSSWNYHYRSSWASASRRLGFLKLHRHLSTDVWIFYHR